MFAYFLQVLEEIKITKKMDRDTLINVARTSLRTKLHPELADLLTEVIIFFLLTCSLKGLMLMVCISQSIITKTKLLNLIGYH